MPTKVVMEALSPTMEEGRLVEWKKQEGEPVAVGDVLAEVETDKAVMELVARAGGTLLKHIVEAGATVPVSELVAVIGEPGDAVDGAQSEKPAGKGDGKPHPTSMPPAAPARVADESSASQPRRPTSSKVEAAPTEAPGRVKASPLARRIAAERGVDLGGVSGSGPEGRIVARDLGAEASTTASAAGAPGATRSVAGPIPRGPSTQTVPAPPFTDVPLTQIRKTIARRLAQSIGPIPTFYLTTEVDMDRVWEAREALQSAGQRGSEAVAQEVRVSFNDIIIKAVAMALRQHPACNAWWQDDHIRYWNEVHISMAVAVEEGLITPVIRNTDQKTLREIAAESRDLAARARERRLRPDEYTGGTFSISNLGMLDIDEFTAVINPPEAAILAVGRIAEKPVVQNGTLAIGRRLRLTMSCDHRVIDGATGAQFLKTLKEMLQNPLAIVW